MRSAGLPSCASDNKATPMRRAQAHGAGRDRKVERRMSNFPLRYKLSWLPRLLKPSLGGERPRLAAARRLAAGAGAAATLGRLVFIGDISAVASRAAPDGRRAAAALIASADLVVGNCESPVVERRAQTVQDGRGNAPRDDRCVPVRCARRRGDRPQAPGAVARQQSHARPGHRRLCRNAGSACRDGHRHHRRSRRRAGSRTRSSAA